MTSERRGALCLTLPQPLSFLTGQDYEWYGVKYFTAFFSYGQTHSVNYLKYPHMLDSHSAFHLPPEIKVRLVPRSRGGRAYKVPFVF